jgi:hypothetical protein
MEINWFSPSHRLSLVLKAPEEQKHAFLASGFHLGLYHAPLCIFLS